jgi:DNA-3-methyladenine glycosylase II
MNEIVNKSDIKELAEKDATFLNIIEKYGNPPNWTREQGFVSLSKIILEQQVSLASANAHFKKLNTYLPEFSPKEILKLSDEEMRTCQISRQKATYLRALSTAVIERCIIFESFESLPEQEIRERLTNVKGIGKWTSDIYMMFCLQSKDIFPFGDIAVMNTVKELYKVKTKEEIINLSETWKPLRSLAAYCFWHYYLRSRNRA